MTMRRLSEAFLDDYLAREGEALLGSVGGYHFEGRGAQLFERSKAIISPSWDCRCCRFWRHLRAQGLLES